MPAYKYTLTDGTRGTMIAPEHRLEDVLDGLYLKFGEDRVVRVETMDGLEVLTGDDDGR